ncbi:hypothetical protein [Marinobacter sp. M-5]|uniref:hypothetical protein n=1 Tax=Marinobacter sp. M-5 TaxID=3081089 RepID=UPI00293C6367|nr:hypothetical protein [Marinobacter sp. M-5]MDV3503504.1 hypothetical protein [Marinobacter sp. M-5]
MKLEIECVSERAFPALAWVAKFESEKPDVLSVWCGELVEFGPDFVVEGVWPGPFEEKGFDASELFYGSGVRIVGDVVRFVSSCSTVDRIWCHNDNGMVTVSNSLPCLLSIAEVDLVCDDNSYAKAVETIVKGRGYQKHYPVSRGQLQIHYFENVELCGGTLTVVPKTEHTAAFPTYESYSSFLLDTASLIGQNASDAARSRPINVLSTISRGYDSPVASLLARKAGARKAFTIVSARSLIPREDSGAQIAERIGLECEEYTSCRKKFRDELWYWAANGSLQDMNFSIFNYPAGPSVMFTGFNGDMVWSRSGGKVPEDYLKRKDSTGLGFCEHRLVKGVIHCPVPFWGIRHIGDIKRLSEDVAMQPWSVGGDYDRPVPRRIAEEAGIPRELFGQTKSATTVDELLLMPLANQLKAEYKRFLSVHHNNVFTLQVLYLLRRLIDAWRSLFRQRVLDVFARSARLRNRSRTFRWENYLFPWANQSLKPNFVLDKEANG